MDVSGCGGPLRGTFANCTHIIVSLLKAWKVTVVGIEWTMLPFNVISRRSTPEIVLSRKIVQKFVSKVANLIIVEILKYLY